VGLDRISVGAHWPSDVLAGTLIATAWLTFVVSVRWISDREFAIKAKPAAPPPLARAESAAVGS
jgi:membrane-associated phospholipid phosphatase